ncbi:hypothetical protein NZ47_05065 [Anaerovibrio lipolyticus]|uniref:DUF3892 domain-containing protein n=1 Tax=Anaerovibrio lipolyticus TaxID=82374 RepID=A0A0B2K0Q1_9FIRM|nr:DUF3892 domain-containing protein [Anaerovibrio lipolyticus]KHM52401.1 hypothetical protein NZ47_05065 [Anaerovibrio lipolyticus]
MNFKRLTVTKESNTGRNIEFRDNMTGEIISDKEAIKRTENGMYTDYMVQIRYGKKTLVSKPDGDKNNNLN